MEILFHHGLAVSRGVIARLGCGGENAKNGWQQYPEMLTHGLGVAGSSAGCDEKVYYIVFNYYVER